MGGMTTPEPRELTRLSVNLIAKAKRDLDSAASITGYSQTDTVNRALQFYAFYLEHVEAGDDILLRRQDGGELERILLA